MGDATRILTVIESGDRKAADEQGTAKKQVLSGAGDVRSAEVVRIVEASQGHVFSSSAESVRALKSENRKTAEMRGG